MAKRKALEEYEVGYARPPKASRFKPGQSGNPRGRPKGAKNVETILQDVLLRPITAMEGGKRKQITVLEAFFKRLSKLAVEGIRGRPTG